MLVFEGTSPTDARDWVHNVGQGGGNVSRQYELAIGLTRELKDNLGFELTLAGHSLGGGLATASSLVNGVNAFVVNPAGVHPNTLARHNADFTRSNELVDVMRLWGDVLTAGQTLSKGLPAPDTVGNILTIPTEGTAPSFISNHGAGKVVSLIEKLLKSRLD